MNAFHRLPNSKAANCSDWVKFVRSCGTSVPGCPDVGWASAFLVLGEGPNPTQPLSLPAAVGRLNPASTEPPLVGGAYGGDWWDAGLEDPNGAVAISGQ